ncbi:MAG TPA: hypothetical protein VF403_15905 [Kofleriaceae bacterium]
MGFLSKLFGGRETPEERIVRAQRHIDEGEPELAVRTLSSLDGDEAAAVRNRAIAAIDARDAQPDPEPELVDPIDDEDEELPRQPAQGGTPAGGIGISFGADGSTRIESAGTVVTLNQPVSDDDGRPRSTDGVAIARGVLEAVREQPMDPRAFAFIDAALLLGREKAATPAMRHPQRQAVLELALAASTRDPAKVIAAIHDAPEIAADEVGYFAATVAAFAAKQLAAERRVMPSLQLVSAILTSAPELCLGVVERAQPTFAGAALLLAEAAGVAVPGLDERWRDFQAIDASDEDRAAWRAFAIRRIARTDAAAAYALYDDEETPEEWDDGVTFALAKADPVRGRAMLRELGPVVDHAGWLRGCVAGDSGADTLALVDEWIAGLDPITYHPYAYFEVVLDACLVLGDVARTRTLLAKGGPTGWQVATAAHHGLAATTGDRAALLAALYERVTPGIVAGRAVARGGFPLGAGKMVIQPAWLDFATPHPIETLAIVVALGADNPRWS